MNHETIEHFGETTILYTWNDESKAHVDFRVVEVVGRDVTIADGKAPATHHERGYQRPGSNFSPDFVFDPHEAENYLHGSVKWDGCMNFIVGAEDGVMMHACDTDDIERISETLLRVRSMSLQIMRDHGVHVL